MTEKPKTDVAVAIQNAFWVADVMTSGLPVMLADAQSLKEHAPSSGAGEVAQHLVEQIDGFAVALGVLREQLSTIALAGLEAGK